MTRLHLRPRSIEDYLDTSEIAAVDPWMCEKFKPQDRPCHATDIECKKFCDAIKPGLWPPDLSLPLLRLLQLPSDIAMVGLHRLQVQQKKVLFSSIVAGQALSKFPTDSVLTAPLNDGLSLFYWRLNKLPTVDSNSRLIMIRKSSFQRWEIRFITVNEIFRFMGKPLLEIFSPSQYGEVARQLSMWSMIDLAGASFHEGAMLGHFISSVYASERRLGDAR